MTADRSERRTALIRHKFRYYNNNITALSDTGPLIASSSGVAMLAKRDVKQGVGFTVIAITIVEKLVGPPKAVINRIMCLRLPLVFGKKHLSINSLVLIVMTLTNPD